MEIHTCNCRSTNDRNRKYSNIEHTSTGHKKQEVLNDIERLEMDVVVLTETVEKEQGQQILRNYHLVWSGVN